MEVRGSTVIITGASSGIGSAAARGLARLGAKVVLAARRADQLYALVSEIERQGGQALAVPTDVRERAQIDHLVQAAVERYGRVDVLINNAGIGAGRFMTVSDEDMERVVTVNLLAPARCAQAVQPYMRRQGAGLIINIGSVLGEIGARGIYSATKFGLRGLNDALRRELKGDNIDVVLIEPGFIRTSMTADLKFPISDPDIVIRAIVKAFQRPMRKMIIPWPYGLLTAVAKLLPGLTDLVMSIESVRRFHEPRQAV